MKRLLELRNKLKRKKPKFNRTDSNKYKQFKNWRKPRGLHNKRRLSKKGHQKNPSSGYRSPKEVKGLDRNGLREKIVKNISDLKKITEGDIAILSSTLGLKKKINILEEAKGKNIHVKGIKDIEEFLKKVKEKIEKEKQERKKKKEKKEKKKAEAEKKKKEKEKKEKEQKSEDKQKELSKEAKIEQKPQPPVGEGKQQQKPMPKQTAPKSE